MSNIRHMTRNKIDQIGYTRSPSNKIVPVSAMPTSATSISAPRKESELIKAFTSQVVQEHPHAKLLMDHKLALETMLKNAPNKTPEEQALNKERSMIVDKLNECLRTAHSDTIQVMNSFDGKDTLIISSNSESDFYRLLGKGHVSKVFQVTNVTALSGLSAKYPIFLAKATRECDFSPREIQIYHALESIDGVVHPVAMHKNVAIFPIGEVIYRLPANISDQQIRDIIRSLAQTLKLMHAQAVIHNDISIENILFFTEDDKIAVKYIDFETSEILDSASLDTYIKLDTRDVTITISVLIKRTRGSLEHILTDQQMDIISKIKAGLDFVNPACLHSDFDVPTLDELIETLLDDGDSR